MSGENDQNKGVTETVDIVKNEAVEVTKSLENTESCVKNIGNLANRVDSHLDQETDSFAIKKSIIVKSKVSFVSKLYLLKESIKIKFESLPYIWNSCQTTIAWFSLVMILIAVFFTISWFAESELRSLDKRFLLKKNIPQSEKIVLAEINDDSVKIGNGLGYWPWSRKIHASILNHLKLYFNPELVAFDVLFLTPTDKKSDFIFSRMIQKMGCVYLPFVFNLSKNKQLNLSGKITGIEEPYRPFKKGIAGTGYINAPVDIDGNYRRVPLLLKYKNKWEPQLAFKIALDYLGVSLQDLIIEPGNYIKFKDKNNLLYKIPVDKEYQMIIGWVGTWEESFRHISCLDIIQVIEAKKMKKKSATLDVDSLQNKIIIIGELTTGSIDVRKTPYEDNCPMVLTHALILNQIFNRYFIKEIPVWVNFLYCILLAIFISYITLNYSPMKGLFVSVIFIILVYLFSNLLFVKFNLILNMIRPFYTVISTFLLLGTYNHIRFKDHVDLKLSFEQKLSMADGKLPQFRTNLNIGEYSNITELGRGGMAIVYKGRGKDGNEYAIKVISPECLAKDKLFKYRFKREIATMKKVSHNNVIRVFSSGTYQGVLYYSMEYFKAGDLGEHLNDLHNIKDWKQLAGFIQSLFKGLKAIHDAGLIHRDIKPANIMMNDAFEIKIADFGLAKSVDEGQILTTVGQVLGTPAYLAPELCKGSDPSVQADIYAMGIIVYEIISGVRPFSECSTLAALMQLKLQSNIPTIKLKRIDITDEFAEIVDKLVATDPSGRYITADEVIDDLTYIS